jgi:hypothetical protein
MCNTKLLSIAFACAFALVSARAQQTDPNNPNSNKGSVFLDNNREKPVKPSSARTITGLVKDQNDNPVGGAIVQLKDMKTSKIVDFPTKEDGKFAFRDLHLDVDYELIAKRGGITSPVKKVSTFDTRKEVVLTFRLEPPSKETAR